MLNYEGSGYSAIILKKKNIWLVADAFPHLGYKNTFYHPISHFGLHFRFWVWQKQYDGSYKNNMKILFHGTHEIFSFGLYDGSYKKNMKNNILTWGRLTMMDHTNFVPKLNTWGVLSDGKRRHMRWLHFFQTSYCRVLYPLIFVSSMKFLGPYIPYFMICPI